MNSINFLWQSTLDYKVNPPAPLNRLNLRAVSPFTKIFIIFFIFFKPPPSPYILNLFEISLCGDMI